MTIHSFEAPATMGTFSTDKDIDMHDLLPNLSVNLPSPMQPRNIYFEANVLPRGFVALNASGDEKPNILKSRYPNLPPPYPRTPPALLSNNVSSTSLAESSSYYSSSAISDYSSSYEDSDKEYNDSPSTSSYSHSYYPLTSPALRGVSSHNRTSSIRMLLNPPNGPANHFASEHTHAMTRTPPSTSISSASSSPQFPPIIHHNMPNKQQVKHPYKCTYCPKAFIRPSSLRVHTYSHTGEKPFYCSYPGCGRRFSVQSNMKRHLRVHSS